MGRKRRPNEPSSYQRAPQVPLGETERYAVISAVLAGALTVSEGARRLEMARNNFQTLLHRVQQAMLESLQPRPTGPRPKPARQTELESQVKRLEREKEKLTGQIETMDRLLGVAGEVIRGLRGGSARPRSKRSSPSSTSSSKGGSEPEDPEPLPSLGKVAGMCERGARVARALGLGASTLRRWRARRRHGLPMCWPRGPRRQVPTAAAAAEVRAMVRRLRGLAGAAALAHSVDGVSRRAAAALKAEELSEMERERRADCGRVEVLTPGVLRGFDAMHLITTAGRGYALVAADAAVPYRTTISPVPSYDGVHVARVLEADFERHGAPLVCRLDRASCHATAEVVSVLEAHRVLVLHGPPRHPRYYGQLERQNREHRAWLGCLGVLTAAEIEAECQRMQAALNGLWRRRRLEWRTAESAWEGRPRVTDDRTELHDEVTDRARRLHDEGVAEDLAMRLAIEKALTTRGHLRVTMGRRVAT